MASLLAVSGSGYIWEENIFTSFDGVTWNSMTFVTNDVLNRVTYGNNNFVAVVANGVILTSPDGITWAERSEIAVASSIMKDIEEDLLDDQHTVSHICWLEIAAHEKIEEMRNAIEDAQCLESRSKPAKEKAKDDSQGTAT